jgi:hypothetical protein
MRCCDTETDDCYVVEVTSTALLRLEGKYVGDYRNTADDGFVGMDGGM